MKRLPIFVSLLIIVVSCSKPSLPILELPALIGEGMVLQQNSDVVLWGEINPNRKIEITTSWGIRERVKADKEGNWSANIKTQGAGGPFEIAFQTSDTSTIVNDVYLGEVWLCSGQSNMEMTLTGWPPSDSINNSEEEIANADFPLIRLFNVARSTSAKPLTSCVGSWSVCSPETAQNYSATAYFFGRELHQKLNVPIGLITSSWGGTPAESWTSGEFVKEIPAYSDILESLDIAEIQYDSLMVWMERLPTLPIDMDNTDFYANLNYNDEALASVDFDDSSWDVLTVPSFWESTKLPGFDGVVWYRKKFEVPASLSGAQMTLYLGAIDDMDETFINGQKIGATMESGKWKEERNYTIPAGLLVEGENVLAVRVVDNMGGGGIYGDEEISLKNKSGKSIKLEGEWKYFPAAEIISNKIYFYTDEENFSSRPEVSFSFNAYTPTALYNAMIHPLIPYTIQGAIWYQGEANVGRGFEYRSLFPAMIECWRSVWNQGDFPFYFVQIAPFDYGEKEKSQTAELREAQFMTLDLPNTGMAVTMDIGNPENIHPANKQDVGKRLALWAMAKDYGFDSIAYSGPLYKSISIEGSKAIVRFNYVDGGLITKGADLTHFEIAGKDQMYHAAKAVIEDETVVVTSDKVTEPVAVRYGWSATAEPNLFNAAGLPASPFRTDDWRRLSE